MSSTKYFSNPRLLDDASLDPVILHEIWYECIIRRSSDAANRDNRYMINMEIKVLNNPNISEKTLSRGLEIVLLSLFHISLNKPSKLKLSNTVAEFNAIAYNQVLPLLLLENPNFLEELKIISFLKNQTLGDKSKLFLLLDSCKKINKAFKEVLKYLLTK